MPCLDGRVYSPGGCTWWNSFACGSSGHVPSTNYHGPRDKVLHTNEICRRSPGNTAARILVLQFLCGLPNTWGSNVERQIKLYYPLYYYTTLYYTILYYTILYYTILYYTILYYTILYYTILYYTILYYTILYYTILYYTILYYTIFH